MGEVLRVEKKIRGWSVTIEHHYNTHTTYGFVINSQHTRPAHFVVSRDKTHWGSKWVIRWTLPDWAPKYVKNFVYQQVCEILGKGNVLKE